MYFDNCTTIEELKKEYRKLAMKHHPDRGGDLETMQKINAEHDEAFERIKAGESRNTAKGGNHSQSSETAAEFRDIIDRLIRIDGIVIEVCGCWLWISGDTYAHREELKAAGCKYSNNKKMWYWHRAEDWTRNRRKSSMAEIRMKYGSEIVGAASTTSIVTA